MSSSPIVFQIPDVLIVEVKPTGSNLIFNIDEQCNFNGERQRGLEMFIKNVRLTSIVKLLNFDILFKSILT